MVVGSPSNRTPTCVVCGNPIREDRGETPVFVGKEFEFGDYDGNAYHLQECENEVFEEVCSEVE
jgi:hypothetical protein